MKILWVFAVSLALVGCRQGDGQQEVVNRLKALETEMAKQRPVPLRWAFADRAKITEAIHARAREKVGELKKAENLSPELAAKVAEYEALNRELMLSGLRRPDSYPPRRIIPERITLTAPDSGRLPERVDTEASKARVQAQFAALVTNGMFAAPPLPPAPVDPAPSPRLVPSRDGLTVREVPVRPARLAPGGSTPPTPSPVNPDPPRPMAGRFDLSEPPPAATEEDKAYQAMARRVAEAKAPVAAILDRRTQVTMEYYAPAFLNRLIADYAKDRYDILLDSTPEKSLYRAAIETREIDITEAVIQFFCDREKQ